MRAFSITKKPSLLPTTILTPVRLASWTARKSLHRLLPNGALDLDNFINLPSHSSSHIILPTIAATLLPRDVAHDHAITTAVTSVLFEQQINSSQDARTALLEAFRLRKSLDPVIATSLAVRITQVAMATNAFALLPATIAFFLRVTIHHPSPDASYRHIVKQIVGSSTTSSSTNEPLVKLVVMARRRCVEFDDSTYWALADGGRKSLQLLCAVRDHMVSLGRALPERRITDLLHILSSDKHYTSPIPELRRLARVKTPLIKSEIISTTDAGVRPPSRSTSHHILLLRRLHHPSLARYYVRLIGNGSSSIWGLRKGAKPLSIALWTTFLKRRIVSPGFKAATLLRMLGTIETSTGKYPLNVSVYTAFIEALVFRKEWGLAWSVWEKMRMRCWQDAKAGGREWILDASALRMGVIVLCRHRRDYAEAFRLLHSLGSMDDQRAGALIPATVRMVNQLLDELRRANRADAVYQVWQGMSREYGVQRDNRTLVVVLSAASSGSVGGETRGSPGGVERFAMTMADRFHKAMASSRRRKLLTNHADLSQISYRRRMEIILSRKELRREDVFWDGLIAWQRARLIFLEIVLGNWPGLAALRFSASAAEPWVQPSPRRLLRHPAASTASYPHHIEFDTTAHLHDIPPPPATSLYPEIMPNDTTFRAYISLLGSHGLSSEIPQAMVWMRALGIDPTRETVALALAFSLEDEDTAEVPLVAAYGFSGRKNGPDHFRLWMTQWVASKMPSEDDSHRLMMELRRKRELQEWQDSDDRGVS